MNSEPIVILMPVYNDWDACALLLSRLDDDLAKEGIRARILIVDDGSTAQRVEHRNGFRAVDPIEVLALEQNLGHQRAICVGLTYVEASIPTQAVVIMDSDGEDCPSDVPRLIHALEQQSNDPIVFAERTKRSESLFFRASYLTYRVLHWLMTGIQVRVGNFSIVPQSRLRSLVLSPALWVHYAATVFASRIPYCTIPTVRAKRLDGCSRMNVPNLLLHGLGALSVFSHLIGARILLATVPCILLGIVGIAAVVFIRVFTNAGVPGWATYTVGLMVISLMQLLVLAIVAIVIILGRRSQADFLPVRDCRIFVKGVSPYNR